MKSNFQLESEGFNLKAIENMWSSNSATVSGGSSFPYQPSETNPMDCQAEPFLQIGYVSIFLLSYVVIYTSKL